MKRAQEFGNEKLSRRAWFVRGSGKDRTIQIALSSEHPVDRGYFLEVLSHNESDVDLSRLNNAHPLLVGHDQSDQIGVIEKAWLDDDRRCRCLVRFGNSDRAEEIYQDVLDNVRPHVSVGYTHTAELSNEPDQNSGKPTIRFAWMPYEVSIVPVPADPTVGVGRALDTRHNMTDYYCDKCGSYMDVEDNHHKVEDKILCTQCFSGNRDCRSMCPRCGMKDSELLIRGDFERLMQCQSCGEAFKLTV